MRSAKCGSAEARAIAGALLLVLAVAACTDSRAEPGAGSQPAARDESSVERQAASPPAVQAALRAESPTVGKDGRWELRVCADPNNLPFSNEKGEGFENRLAELLAREMGRTVRYTWWAQRRGFIRNTLRAGECDLVAGIPSSFELVMPTRPYYRSTYVFVYRKDAGFRVRSFDDPVLKRLKIGVHLVGDDGANTPPAHALSTRGIVGNVRGYTLYGDYSRPNPPARILGALAEGEIDVAIVWGPLAGYCAPRARVPLEVVPVSPQIDVPFLPFVYDISMGVRRDDAALLAEVQQVLTRRRDEVEAILDEYGVPRVGPRRSSGH